jgi:4-hydroxy-tetrahydrodipicolinate synthase
MTMRELIRAYDTVKRSDRIVQVGTQVRSYPNSAGAKKMISGGGLGTITLPLAALGGRGIISVASNEIPAEMTALARLSLANDFPAARALQRKYLPLMEVNFVESNPIPVKAAMAMMGLLEPVWRLPMVPPQPQNQARIEKVLTELGLVANRSVQVAG